ncbi:siderophore-interacting protein [Reinekea thalattae]|uniref:Siderophore-interacting protein n=1 Tax=Reinekea thalattae TaxID=2593301 RepID=A0A5C8Z6C6_9GAMM|nr:siderophore-interacting protein [Reinekea thalattae]TXR53177.1 siderophore-interacting protein [Reinekea thalattae]
MKKSYTAIQDIDLKQDIIDHVNQNHQHEVNIIASSQVTQEPVSRATLVDIFHEGIMVQLFYKEIETANTVFIPFEVEGSIEEKIFYLAYIAAVKQGIDLNNTGTCFFEVIKKENITKNIIRLTVKTQTSLPEYYAGYAYAFSLKSLKHHSTKQQKNKKSDQWLKALLNRFFVWLLKHISKESRRKLLAKTKKNTRPYTLRKAWKSNESSLHNDLAYVDIYTHNDTAGSLWAKNLIIGDIIMSQSESKDNHPHLKEGQALLIADETAYPAIAGILELWQNPTAPILITISSKSTEQSYFDSIVLPEGTQIHNIICTPQDQAEEVISTIEKIKNIDAVWAAFESVSAKKVRHYLRNKRALPGKNNNVKAYWRIK